MRVGGARVRDFGQTSLGQGLPCASSRVVLSTHRHPRMPAGPPAHASRELMPECMPAPLSERLHECGATGELVKMLGLAVEQRAASIDHRRSLAATLALFNMSSLPACAEQMAASKTEALLSTVMRATYTRARAQRPPALNAGEAQGPADTADAIETSVAPELKVAGNCSEAGCGAGGYGARGTTMPRTTPTVASTRRQGGAAAWDKVCGAV